MNTTLNALPGRSLLLALTASAVIGTAPAAVVSSTTSGLTTTTVIREDIWFDTLSLVPDTIVGNSGNVASKISPNVGTVVGFYDSSTDGIGSDPITSATFTLTLSSFSGTFGIGSQQMTNAPEWTSAQSWNTAVFHVNGGEPSIAGSLTPAGGGSLATVTFDVTGQVQSDENFFVWLNETSGGTHTRVDSTLTVVTTAVPEPGSALLACIGGVMCLVRRSRDGRTLWISKA